jgi:hypothetical protein
MPYGWNEDWPGPMPLGLYLLPGLLYPGKSLSNVKTFLGQKTWTFMEPSVLLYGYTPR